MLASIQVDRTLEEQRVCRKGTCGEVPPLCIVMHSGNTSTTERSRQLPEPRRTHAINPDGMLCALGARQEQVVVVQPGNKLLHRPVAPHPLRKALRSGMLALSLGVFALSCKPVWGPV